MPPTPPPGTFEDDTDSEEEIVFHRGRRRPITADIDGLTTPRARSTKSSRVLRRVRANIHEVSPSVSPTPPVAMGVNAPPTPPKEPVAIALHHPKSLKRSLKSAYFADGTEIPGLKEHLENEKNMHDLDEFVWKDDVVEGPVEEDRERRVSSIGELSVGDTLEISEALYAEFAMAHEIGIALGSPPVAERKIMSMDEMGYGTIEGNPEYERQVPRSEPEPLALSILQDGDEEHEDENQRMGSDESKDITEGNQWEELEVEEKGERREEMEVEIEDEGEIVIGSVGEPNEAEDEEEEIAQLGGEFELNGIGGPKLTLWPTEGVTSYQSAVQNREGDDASAGHSEAVETETFNTELGEDAYGSEDDDGDEIFYDAEEGALSSPPVSPSARSHFEPRHPGIDEATAGSPTLTQGAEGGAMLVQSPPMEPAPPGTLPLSNGPQTPPRALQSSGAPALNVIPPTPLPLLSPTAELKKQLGHHSIPLLQRKPTGDIPALNRSEEPPSSSPSPTPKRSFSLTKKTPRPSLSSQPERMRGSKLHPWWRPRHTNPEGGPLSRTTSAPQMPLLERADSAAKKRITKPIKGTKFQIEFIGVGTIKEKGEALKGKLNTGGDAMKRKFSLKKKNT